MLASSPAKLVMGQGTNKSKIVPDGEGLAKRISKKSAFDPFTRALIHTRTPVCLHKRLQLKVSHEVDKMDVD